MKPLAYELLGQRGHSAVLRAYEGTDFDGQLVGLSNCLTAEEGCAEATGEGVAGTYGVGHLNLRSIAERHLTRHNR